MPRKLTTENDVKKLVKEWFDSVNAWHYAPIQTGMGVHGIPDRIGCVPVTITPDMVGKTLGLFVAVECKRPGRRGEERGGLSPAQAQQVDSIDHAYGYVIVCDGEEDIKRLHDKIQEPRNG